MPSADAIVYSEFPKWLKHSSRSPVIVNDAEQEKSFVADGYFAPACSDPEGYLLSKVTTKLDDAIRTMNSNLERKFSVELSHLNNKINAMVSDSLLRLHKKQLSLEETGQCLSSLQEGINGAVADSTNCIAVDAMEALRQIAKSTNSG